MTTPVEIVINGRDNTGGAFASAGGALSKIGSIAAGILASQVFTKLAQGAMEFGKSVFTEAMDAQLGLAQLDAVLTSTAGVSGMTRDAVIKLADSFSTMTRFSDDQILSGENMLLTFTNIGQDVFPQATEAILNMSTSLGQDLQSSAIQLGKALNDPVAGVTALQRVGVKLTEEQKKQVESFMAVNDIASAQKVILGELATEFGGSAEAAGKTFAGQMDILKNKVNNLKEGLGMKLMPTIQAFADKMIKFADNPAVLKFFDDLANGIIKMMDFATQLPAMFDNAGSGLRRFIDPFVPAIKSIMSTLEAMRPTIERVASVLITKLAAAGKELSEKVLPFMAEKLQLFADWFEENQPLIEDFAEVMGEAFAFMGEAVVLLWDVISPLLSGIIDLVLEVVKLVMQVATGDWKKAWETMGKIVTIAFNTIKNTLKAALNFIANMMGSSMAQIKAQWSSNWEQLKQIVSQVLTIIGTTITTKFNSFVTSIRTAMTSIVSTVRSIWDQIRAAFVEKINAIYTVILQFGSELRSKIGAAVQAAVGAVQEKLSGFVQAGRDIVGSIISGLEEAAGNLYDYVSGIVQNAIDAALGNSSYTSSYPGNPGYRPPGGANGGPMIGGMPRTVGENGVEIFVPKTNGWLIPNDQVRALAGAGGGTSRVNYYNAHINIFNGVNNPKNAMRGLI